MHREGKWSSVPEIEFEYIRACEPERIKDQGSEIRLVAQKHQVITHIAVKI